MKFKRMWKNCLFLLVILLLPLSRPIAYADGAEFRASYRVLETQDLGTQVRMTLNIRLMNLSDNRLIITQSSLREASPGATAAGASVILDPHAAVEFTRDFTVTKQEYELQQKKRSQMLFLHAQVNGGKETTLTILARR